VTRDTSEPRAHEHFHQPKGTAGVMYNTPAWVQPITLPLHDIAPITTFPRRLHSLLSFKPPEALALKLSRGVFFPDMSPSLRAGRRLRLPSHRAQAYSAHGRGAKQELRPMLSQEKIVSRGQALQVRDIGCVRTCPRCATIIYSLLVGGVRLFPQEKTGLRSSRDG